MFKKILFPLDIANLDSQERTTQAVQALSKLSVGEIYVIAVIPEYGLDKVAGSYFVPGFEEKAKADVRQILHDFVEKNFPNTKVHEIIGTGTTYQQILKCADKIEADAIVMGSHRPELQDYLLGPNSARVVRHANCSVFVIRD